MSKVKKFLPITLFVFFYTLIFLYWVTFNSETGWYLFLFFTLFIIFDSLLMFQSVKKVKLKPLNLSSTNVGKKQLIKLQLTTDQKKKVFFPVLIIRCEELEIEERLIFFFKRNYTWQVEWTPKKRAVLESVTIEVISSDFFGFLTKSKTHSQQTRILILPESLSRTERLLKIIPPNFSRNLFGEPTFNLEKIKPYVPGESMKKIDWKLSSKRQELMVKEYEEYETNPLMFIFYGRASKNFESMLAYFYTLYQDVQTKEVSFFLVGDGVSSQESIDIADFSKLEAKESPGTIPYQKNHQIIIFTPRQTKLLDRELDKLPAHTDIQVIDYDLLESEGTDDVKQI